MKKKWTMVLWVLAAVGLLAACGGAGTEAGTAEVVFELGANPSTGYTWEYTLSEEGVLRETANEFVDGENAGAAGAPGVQKFVFAGAAEGEVEITFTYARTWEEDVLPLKTETFKLKVLPDKSIVLDGHEDGKVQVELPV